MECRPRTGNAVSAGRAATATTSATAVRVTTPATANLNRRRLLQRSIGDREAGRQRLDRPIGDRDVRRCRLDSSSRHCRAPIAATAPTAARLRDVGGPEQEHAQQSCDACRQRKWTSLISRHDILHESGKAGSDIALPVYVIGVTSRPNVPDDIRSTAIVPSVRHASVLRRPIGVKDGGAKRRSGRRFCGAAASPAAEIIGLGGGAGRRCHGMALRCAASAFACLSAAGCGKQDRGRGQPCTSAEDAPGNRALCHGVLGSPMSTGAAGVTERRMRQFLGCRHLRCCHRGYSALRYGCLGRRSHGTQE